MPENAEVSLLCAIAPKAEKTMAKNHIAKTPVRLLDIFNCHPAKPYPLTPAIRSDLRIRQQPGLRWTGAWCHVFTLPMGCGILRRGSLRSDPLRSYLRRQRDASSTSSKSNSIPSMLCTFSCPLPASSTISPGTARPMARPMAARRSSSNSTSVDELSMPARISLAIAA